MLPTSNGVARRRKMTKSEDSLVNDIINEEEQGEESQGDEPQGDEPQGNEEPQEQGTQDEQAISEEFAEKYGLPKWMVGKPMDELGKSYHNINKEFTQRSQELSQMRKEVDNLKQQMTEKADTKKEKEEVKDIFESMPDPVEDDEGFKKWLKEMYNDAQSKAEERALQKIQKQYEPIQQEYQAQKEQQIRNNIESETGENLNDILPQWAKDMGIQSEEEVQMWLNKPDLMVKSVNNWHQAKQYQSLQKSKQDGDAQVGKTKNALKDQKGSELNSNDRQTKKKGVVSELLDDLEFEQQF